MAALPGQLFDTRNVIDDETLVQLDRLSQIAGCAACAARLEE